MKNFEKLVLVFKTNVLLLQESKLLLALLQHEFPGLKLNFDLEDCDHILRAEGNTAEPGNIAALLKRFGYNCDFMSQAMPVGI